MARKPTIMDGFESPRLPGKPFILAAAGTLIFLGLSMGVLFAVFDVSVTDRVQLHAQPAPEPQLLAHPRRDLEKYREDERASLKQTGGNRISIEKAMAMIAARGRDAYAPIDAQGSKP